MSDNEKKGRQLAVSGINGNIKGNVAIKLLKRYTDPNECWTSLKTRYESDSTSKQVLFVDKFFSIRKLNSMDEYLADIKEAVDLVEELDVPLPKRILVAYTLKNLLPKYDMVKQIIMNERKLPSYLDLEARLLNEETSKKMQHNQERDTEALLSFRFGQRRPYNRGNPQNQGRCYSSYIYNQYNQREYQQLSGRYNNSWSLYNGPSGGTMNSGPKGFHQNNRYQPNRHQSDRY